MKNEVYLDLLFADFDDHNEITQCLGITPTHMHIKDHQVNPKFTLLAKKNVWRMSSGLNRYASFEEHMNALLNIIESKIDLFKPLCKKYYCEFACAIYLRYNNG